MTYGRPFDDHGGTSGNSHGVVGNSFAARISATVCKWLGAMENLLRRKSRKKSASPGDDSPDGPDNRDGNTQHRRASAADDHSRIAIEKAVADNLCESIKARSALDAWGRRMSDDVKKVSGDK